MHKSINHAVQYTMVFIVIICAKGSVIGMFKDILEGLKNGTIGYKYYVCALTCNLIFVVS